MLSISCAEFTPLFFRIWFLTAISMIVAIFLPGLTGIYGFLNELKKQVENVQLVFLNAKNEVLIKRFKETRRIHPLSRDGNIIDSVNEERIILNNIREFSDHLIEVIIFVRFTVLVRHSNLSLSE